MVINLDEGDNADWIRIVHRQKEAERRNREKKPLKEVVPKLNKAYGRRKKPKESQA